MEALRAAFRPEFINRIDEIVIFNPLAEQLERIVVLLLKNVEKLLAERQITLELTRPAIELLLHEASIRHTARGRCGGPFSASFRIPWRCRYWKRVLPGDHVRADRHGQKDAMRSNACPPRHRPRSQEITAEINFSPGEGAA